MLQNIHFKTANNVYSCVCLIKSIYIGQVSKCGMTDMSYLNVFFIYYSQYIEILSSVILFLLYLIHVLGCIYVGSFVA